MHSISPVHPYFALTSTLCTLAGVALSSSFSPGSLQSGILPALSGRHIQSRILADRRDLQQTLWPSRKHPIIRPFSNPTSEDQDKSEERDDTPLDFLARLRGGSMPLPEDYEHDAEHHKTPRLLQSYLNQLDERPILTKSWTSGVICGLGDALTQVIFAKAPGQFDPLRLLIFIAMGALYVGPVIHYWFTFLDSSSRSPAVAKRLPNTPTARTLWMLFLDQTFGASVLNSGFLISLWLCQALAYGHLFPLNATVDNISLKWQIEFWPMLLANWKLWPLANFINFSVVPLKFRVLFSNVLSVLWNMYISLATNR